VKLHGALFVLEKVMHILWGLYRLALKYAVLKFDLGMVGILLELLERPVR
jgi:hypothetical protein